MKPLLFPAALLILILGAVAATWSLRHHQAAAGATRDNQTITTSRTIARMHTVRTSDAEPLAPELAALAQSLRDAQAMRSARPAARPAASRPNAAADPDEEDLDPITLARIALSYVGTDPDAEAYWLEMINNPDISAEDRKDLIEDLNESGFPDPDHPTAADLPLIEARIALIEREMPRPMDQTNADAFKEALKDLKEMQAKLKPDGAKTEAPTEPPR